MPACRRCRLIRWLIACLTALAWLSYLSSAGRAAGSAPQLLPITQMNQKHPGPVDFEREILPLFKKNCLACHNAADAEGKLVLESPQTIAKGGDSGPAVVVKEPEKSLLLLRARGGGDGIMPPEDNKVAAGQLQPAELGLLKLWIEQGATGSVRGPGKTVQWQPLAAGMNPIYAVALTVDGQFAACSRANRVFIYQVPTGRLVGRLTDPALVKGPVYSQPGVADLDLIQSLAFSPDASILASGGYRTIKLWRRTAGAQQFSLDKLAISSPLAASADGKFLALANPDYTIRLTDAGGKTLTQLGGHSGPITALDFSPDGTRLCSAAEDRSLRLWNVADRKQVGQLELAGPVTAAVLVDGGKQVAAISGESSIWIGTWPAENALPGDQAKAAGASPAAAGRYLEGHAKPVTALAAMHKNPGQLLSAAGDGQVILWDIASGKQARQFQHAGPVAAVAVRRDDQRIATAGLDKITKLWNPADGKLIAELRGDLRAKARVATADRAVTLAKNSVSESKGVVAEAGKLAAAEGENVKKAAEALAAAHKALDAKIAAHDKLVGDKKAAEGAVAAEQAGKKKAEASLPAAEQFVTVAIASQQQAAEAVAAAKAVVEKALGDKVAATALASAEKAAADAGAVVKSASDAQAAAKNLLPQADQKIAEATARVAELVKSLETAEQERKTAEVAALAAARPLPSAVAAEFKAKDRIQSATAEAAAAEKRVAQADKTLADVSIAAAAAESPVHCVAFSIDGLELATGDAASLVHTWSADSGTALGVYEIAPGAVRGVAYAGDRGLVALAQSRALAWDTLGEWQWSQTLGAGNQLPVDRVTALDFSPDGKLLASGGGAPSRSGELRLWKVVDGKLLRELPNAHSDTVLGVRFSPDGQLLASCGADKFVKVFEVGSGKLVRAFEGHTHHVLGVSWQSNGKMLASAGADNVAKIWELASGEQKATVQGFNKEVTSVTFLGDNPQVLATSGDKSARLVTTTGQSVRNFSGTSDFLYAAAASGDGRIVVVGGQDSVLRAYQSETGQALREFAPPPAAGASAK